MNKKVLLIVLFFPLAVLAVSAREILSLVDSYPGPLELVVRNNSSSPEAMAEIRALNDVNCAVDMGTTSSAYVGDTPGQESKAFLAGESLCSGLQIKNNNPSADVRISTHQGAVISIGQSVLATRTGLAPEVEILFDAGNAYIGSRTNHPTNLMVNRWAKVTLWPNGMVELWRSPDCPAGGVPVNGGALCVDSSGALWWKGPSGTATRLANP